MDVQMPEMDGLEATRGDPRLARERRNRAVPIIAMTAHAMQGDRQRCLEAGMDDYLSKPMSPQALTEVLERWLPRKDGRPGMRGGSDSGGAAGPPPLAGPVVFDRAGMLERLMDDEQLAQKVTDTFLDDIPRQIEALRGHLERGDAGGAGRQAHTIKGASANVGGEALYALAAEIEKAGRAGDCPSAAARVEDLEYEFARFQDALAQTSGNPGPRRDEI